MKIEDVSHSKFDNNVTAVHSGQIDSTLALNINNEMVGRVEYTVYEGVPSISMIEVYSKGQGYGKELVRELQRMYPTEEILWGITTRDGEALRKSLSYKKLKTPYHDIFKEHGTVVQRVKEIKDELEPLWDNVTSENRDYIKSRVNELETLTDQQWELEEELHGQQPYKYIINTDG